MLDQSISSIEDLSNEFFYEIFDYLDPWDIHNAFSNLNYRFQRILNDSSILYKIKLIDPSMSNDTLTKSWTKLGQLNRKQVFSIHLIMSKNINQLAMTLFLDSSFYRLQSLVLIKPESTTLMPILEKLIYLPRLSSLTIKELVDLKDLTAVYRIILALPMLTYYKMSIKFYDVFISLPMSIKPSPLEYLIMNAPCTFNELSTILSYTPQLRLLNFRESVKIDTNIRMIIPLIPIHLTDLRIHVCHLTFDEFEIFLCQLRPKLRVLMFSTSSEAVVYMDAYRWERIILQYLPQLEKFSFQYFGVETDKLNIDFRKTNPFFSSFWLERQWIFETESNIENLVYSIRPYKKRWYEQPNVDHSRMDFSKSIRLTMALIFLDERYDLLLIDIEAVLRITRIHHLEISKKVNIDILIQITNALPHVTTMKLHSLSLEKTRDSGTDELIVFPSTNSINRITKIYLETVTTIKEIDCLMKKYPKMEYLKINSFYHMDVDVFIRNILKKVNHQFHQKLRLLCFPAPPIASDDSIVHIAKRMKIDYTINWVDGFIFLQWK